jgi:hypothetical protein
MATRGPLTPPLRTTFPGCTAQSGRLPRGLKPDVIFPKLNSGGVFSNGPTRGKSLLIEAQQSRGDSRPFSRIQTPAASVSILDSRTTARPRKGKASLVTSTSLEGFPQCAEGPPRARGDEVSRSVCEHGGQDHGLSRGEAIALRSGFLNPKTSSDLEPPRYKHADRPT